MCLVDFLCRKCGAISTLAQYQSSIFCPKCGSLLQVKRTKDVKRSQRTEIEQKQMRLEEIDTKALFYEYKSLRNFDPGGVRVFSDLDEWISARLEAYAHYRTEFSPKKVGDVAHVAGTYKEWLLYRNNFSWTTFQRVGYAALNSPAKLASLLTFVQDEAVPIRERVSQGLKSDRGVAGIGKGIMTAFLHTIFPDHYGVLNSRSIDTLKLLKKYPQESRDIGSMYVEVNCMLQKLARELHCDITTIDGFMWFISKRVKILLP